MYEWQPSEEEYYQMYSILWEKVWDAYYLTEGEKQFWRGEVEKIRKPFIFHEIGRYERFFGIFQTLGVFVLLLQTISLAGMFSEEHSRRTDQINLCTLKGRRSLYWAKIAAGVSYAVFSGVITFTVGYAGLTILYGKGHAEALFQYVYSFYTGTLNCGQAVWIAMGMMLAAAIVYAVGTMFLSELLRNNIAVLGIGAALLMTPMFANIPKRFRLISQVWDWMPFSILNPSILFDARMFSLFGTYHTVWQVLPVIYAAAGILLAVFGKRIYERYQVAGR